MTIDEAKSKAIALWGDLGMVMETSYRGTTHYRVGVSLPGRGPFEMATTGEGPTWEAAFDAAMQNRNPAYVVANGTRVWCVFRENALSGIFATREAAEGKVQRWRTNVGAFGRSPDYQVEEWPIEG